MKTPREFLATHFILSTEDRLAKQDVVALIEARDAEHRAELDETRERLQECGSACGTAGNQCQGCLRRMFNREVERREAIQGELAEARGILTDWPEAPCSRLGQVVTGMAVTSCGRCLSCRRAKHLAGAPPPAESTLIPMRCTASAGSCNSPVACGEAGRCIDTRMREVVGTPAESTPVQSICAFCEGAGRAPPFHNAPCNLCRGTGLRQPAPPDDIRARLERLESEVRYLADTSTHGAMVTLENKVAALEAKGEPGTHAFACKGRRPKDKTDCNTKGFDCVCDCGVKRCDHPKGAKP